MEYKYGQVLPTEIEKQIDEYIERIKHINWLKPLADIKKEDVDNQVSAVKNAFSFYERVEYRKISTVSDWDCSWAAGFGTTWVNATIKARQQIYFATRNSNLGNARDSMRDIIFSSVWQDVRNATRAISNVGTHKEARDAASSVIEYAVLGANDILALTNDEYREKYPNGSFVSLVPLLEMGLYPAGTLGGKFVIFVPPLSQEFPGNLIK